MSALPFQGATALLARVLSPGGALTAAGSGGGPLLLSDGCTSPGVIAIAVASRWSDGRPLALRLSHGGVLARPASFETSHRSTRALPGTIASLAAAFRPHRLRSPNLLSEPSPAPVLELTDEAPVCTRAVCRRRSRHARSLPLPPPPTPSRERPPAIIPGILALRLATTTSSRLRARPSSRVRGRRRRHGRRADLKEDFSVDVSDGPSRHVDQ